MLTMIGTGTKKWHEWESVFHKILINGRSFLTHYKFSHESDDKEGEEDMSAEWNAANDEQNEGAGATS